MYRKSIVGVLVSAALALNLAACGSQPTSPITVEHGQNVPSTVTPKPAETPTPPRVAVVGESQTSADGVVATLLSVKTFKPSEYDSIKTGNQYVVVRVQLENKSTSNAGFADFDFRVQSKAGVLSSTTYASAYEANDELNSGELAPGGKVAGDLVYEVVTADHGAGLVWEPNSLSGETYGWTFAY